MYQHVVSTRSRHFYLMVLELEGFPLPPLDCREGSSSVYQRIVETYGRAIQTTIKHNTHSHSSGGLSLGRGGPGFMLKVKSRSPSVPPTHQ